MEPSITAQRQPIEAQTDGEPRNHLGLGLTAFAVFAWPGYLLAVSFVAALLFSLLVWVWSATLFEVDLTWLEQLTRALADETVWGSISHAFVDNAPFVLGSVLAVLLGLGAAIYTNSTSDTVTHNGLVRVSFGLAAIASGWAWMGLPSAWLSDKPVAALAVLFAAVMISILAGVASMFVRGRRPDTSRLNAERKRHAERARQLGGVRLFSRSGTPIAVLIAWAWVPAIVLSTAQWVLFAVAGQGWATKVVAFNLTLNVMMWTLGLLLAWPIVAARRATLGWIWLGRVALAVAFLLPGVVFGVKLMSNGLAWWGITYVVWALSCLAGFWPLSFKAGMKRKRSPWSGVRRISVSACWVDLRIQQASNLVALLERQIASADSPTAPGP